MAPNCCVPLPTSYLRNLLASLRVTQQHGTQTLIAGLNIATGKVQATCGETRTEEDFTRFISQLIETNPGYETYHIVLDQLNTHKSESLVRFTAEHCNISDTLGISGKIGDVPIVYLSPRFSVSRCCLAA